MNRIAIVLAAGTALLAAPAARAQQAPVQATSAKTFAAVDSVAVQGYLVIVTGIVQGDSAASSWSFNMGPQNPYVESTLNVCAHFGSVAMLKPGAFLLTVSPFGSSPQYSLMGCTLTRVTP